MGLLTRAAAFINDRLGKAAGLALAYTRGPVTLTFTVAGGEAWAGDARFAVTSDGGPSVVFGERQYLILNSAMGALGEPQEGDRIEETVGGEDCVFEVMRPGTGDPAVRWSDPARTRWRVNAKRVV